LEKRKHLPAHNRVSPTRMLQRRPTAAAHRATRIPARHVGRRLGTPTNDERHKRDGYAVTASSAAQPKPVGLMQQCAKRRHSGCRWPWPCRRRIVVGSRRLRMALDRNSAIAGYYSVICRPARSSRASLLTFRSPTRPFWVNGAATNYLRCTAIRRQASTLNSWAAFWTASSGSAAWTLPTIGLWPRDKRPRSLPWAVPVSSPWRQYWPQAESLA